MNECLSYWSDCLGVVVVADDDASSWVVAQSDKRERERDTTQCGGSKHDLHPHLFYSWSPTSPEYVYEYPLYHCTAFAMYYCS